MWLGIEGPSSRVNCKYVSMKSLSLSLIIGALVSPEIMCISEIRGTEFAIGSREEHSISLEYLQSDSRESTFRSTKPTRWTTGTRLIRFRRNAAYRRPRHTCASTCYHISSGAKLNWQIASKENPIYALGCVRYTLMINGHNFRAFFLLFAMFEINFCW